MIGYPGAMRWMPLIALALVGCDPYAGWPDPRSVFPWQVDDDRELEPYESVRWEEGPWDPLQAPENNGLYLQKALFHSPSTPTDALFHWGLMRPLVPPLAEDALQLAFVGDILHTGNPSTDFSAVAGLLDRANLRVGNLETPVAPSVTAGEGKPGVPLFNAPASLLDELPLDVVQVINNHTLDVGDAGLEETLALLEERGIFAFGVDGQLLLDFGEGFVVALLGYTWGLNDPAASSATHDLAIVPFGAPGRPDLSRIEADIATAREAGATLVVVLPHWGYEYEYYPDPHFLKQGRRMIEAGADLVVGHGSHTVQPAEWCTVNVPANVPGVGSCSLRTADGQPRYGAIFHSLGNFGTDQPGLALRAGMIGHVSLVPDVGVVGMGWEPVVSVERDERQVVLPLDALADDPDEGDAVQAEAARLDQHLGTGWKLE